MGGGREVVVETLCVEAGDLVVLAAVVGKELAAATLEAVQVGGPGADVGGVERVGDGGVVGGEEGGVPGGGVHYVSEPALGVWGTDVSWKRHRGGLGEGAQLPRSS